jgi:NADH-quinone oxidoreductase subunit C
VTASPSEIADRFAELVGGESSSEFATAKIRVPAERWVEVHEALKPHLPFFSFLSAIDWATEVAVGDPPEESVEDRFEVFSRLSDVTDGVGLIISTDVPKGEPRIATLTAVYGGADWHEREAAEMFGIVFEGHPHLVNLYLPDGFAGHPLRKTFPLLSREVKPWPGTVDVEDMPSTENVEGGDGDGDGEEGS